MDLVIIKQILLIAGITNLAIRFDDPNRSIIATFTKDKQVRTRLIKFAEIESLFTERDRRCTANRPPSQATAGSPLDETPVSGG